MVSLLDERRPDPHNGSAQRITFDSQGPFGHLVEAKKQQSRDRREQSAGRRTKVITDSSTSKCGPKKSAMKLVPKHSGSEMGTINSVHNHNLNDEPSFEQAQKSRANRQRSERSESSRDKSSVSRKTSKSRMSAKSKKSRSKSPRSVSGSRRIKKKSANGSAAPRKLSESQERREPQVQVSTERGSRTNKSGLAEAKKKTREAMLTELIRFKKPVLPSKKKPASSVSSDKADKSTEVKKAKKRPALDENLSLHERRPHDPANKSGSTKSRGASGAKPPPHKLAAASVRSREKDPVLFSHVSSLLPSKVGSLASDGLQTRKRKSVAVPKSHNK